MEITPVRRSTITDQILEQLGELIQSGKLKPGDKLPNERDLAEMFGTTRARIREAFRALALIGLIETRPGDGSYVTEVHDIPNETLALMFYQERNKFDELYTVRRIIEKPIYQMCAEKIKPEHIEKLEKVLERCEQLLATDPDPEKFLMLINEYDRIMVSATDNSVMVKLMELFNGMKEQANLILFRVPDTMRNSLVHRREILSAVISRDPRKLDESLEEHYSSAKPFFSDIAEDEAQTGNPQ